MLKESHLFFLFWGVGAVVYNSIDTATSSLVEFFSPLTLLKVFFFALYTAVIDSSKAMLRVRFYLMCGPPPPGITIARAGVTWESLFSRPRLYILYIMYTHHTNTRVRCIPKELCTAQAFFLCFCTNVL